MTRDHLGNVMSGEEDKQRAKLVSYMLPTTTFEKKSCYASYKLQDRPQAWHKTITTLYNASEFDKMSESKSRLQRPYKKENQEEQNLRREMIQMHR